MNCREFENSVGEVAAGHLMDAVLRSAALAHAADCNHCAAQLAREQTVLAGLRTLRAQEAAVRAPDRVRQSLRAAFDARQAASLPTPTRFPTRRKWWALAAAAALLLICGVAAALWPGKMEEVKVRNLPPSSPPATPSSATAAPPRVALTGSQSPAARPPARVTRQLAASVARDSARSRKQVSSAESSAEGNDESAEFLMLASAGQPEPTEIEQVLSIEIPRSTLMMWGLPVNAERAAERVRADLIIGDDGVTRAIRIRN